MFDLFFICSYIIIFFFGVFSIGYFLSSLLIRLLRW